LPVIITRSKHDSIMQSVTAMRVDSPGVSSASGFNMFCPAVG